MATVPVTIPHRAEGAPSRRVALVPGEFSNDPEGAPGPSPLGTGESQTSTRKYFGRWPGHEIITDLAGGPVIRIGMSRKKLCPFITVLS